MMKTETRLGKRIISHLKNLSPVKELDQNKVCVTRLAYSAEEKTAKDYFIAHCLKENLAVRTDSAGNIIACRAGQKASAPAVACGSHLDSVLNGGIYDGALGVMCALEVVRKLNREKIMTEHPVEIIVFSSEESSRFGVSTIGSQAMTGLINTDILKSLKDRDGISFEKAIQGQNLKLEEFPLAKRKPDELKAFLELHIEQGPLLEAKGHTIGIVSNIAAPTRYAIIVEGKSGHSGTTVMSLRKDALTAASEIVLAVEQLAKNEEELGSVGTVGALKVTPGTANTIPGKVELIVEFRSIHDENKQKLKQKFLSTVHHIEQKREVSVQINQLSDEKPVPLDPSIHDVIQSVCQSEQYSYLRMVSGAGHDAMNLARMCPTGLIFVPSVGGISHNPAEFTHEKDIEAGFHVLYETILKLAKGVA